MANVKNTFDVDSCPVGLIRLVSFHVAYICALMYYLYPLLFESRLEL